MRHSQITALAIGLAGACLVSSAIAVEPDRGNARTLTGEAVRHDTSPPMSELLRIMEERRSDPNRTLKGPTYTYPNITENPEQLDGADPTRMSNDNPSVQRQLLGDPAPSVILSFDGISQNDAPGGGLPPDTNGDVGIDYYVQYINTDWAVYDKTDGTRLTPVMEGNTFWAGFGGLCETENSGDPLVLFDKTANVWVFTQFTGASQPDGVQCFAISDRQDLLDPDLTFNRYQFNFTGIFNDYPHIGIWNDEAGGTSGYYFVTHDFSLPPALNFLQASFGVVERDAMIAGGPAQFVRITDTEAFGQSSFGAMPVHLESEALPPAGMCAPFVHNRADLDSYLLWQLCVDWSDANAANLTDPLLIAANAPFDNGMNDVPQPPPAPAGSELDNFGGNTMYRASARAYPSESGLPVEMAINHATNAGDGIAGVRWVHLALPSTSTATMPPAGQIFVDGFETLFAPPAILDNPLILDQGVYSPDDDYRWMGAISLDQNGNLGLAYTVSSPTTFPSVRFTGKTADVPAGMMLDEAVCVDGGGVQTFVDPSGRAGRWGDYSSVSIDPVDQCTFWATVEYVAATGQANWENRICSFRFPECGNPDFRLTSTQGSPISVCTVDGDPVIDLTVNPLIGFNSDVTLSASPLGGTASVVFGSNPLTSFPANTTATLMGLDTVGVTQLTLDITATSAAPALSRSLSYDLTVSNGTAGAAALQSPANAADEQLVRPSFDWDDVPDALVYTIEIATDAAFSNIIETGQSLISSYMAQGSLDPTTQYFWRVTTGNNCGTGTVSAEFSFTTDVPGTCPSGTSPNIVFTDDIEGDVTDWMTPPDPLGLGNTWAQSTVRFNSGANSFLAVDQNMSSDQYLISPAITLPAADQSPITLSFWNFQNIEARSGTGIDACWDGGLLEVSTDGGANFVQVQNTRLLTDPYNGTTFVQTASPISGLEAWCADDIVSASGVQETVQVVDLDELAGQTVQFRFRLGTDNAAGDEGWYIDDVTVQGCVVN